jgi:hypothetical protein
LRQILFQIGKKNLMEAFHMLRQAYGEDCLSHTQYHKRYQRFKSGRTSVKDDPKSGGPSTSMDDDHVEKVLAVNRRLTLCEVA